jgi:hypothetical protein
MTRGAGSRLRVAVRVEGKRTFQMSRDLAGLRRFLAAAGPGHIEDADALVGLLAAAWPSFAGADDEAMASWKLSRIEDPEWRPPLLTFLIERHGAVALGGTRADLQHWTVNLDTLTASPEPAGRRQLRPLVPRLKVEPLVAEIVELVAAGVEDDRLGWSTDRQTVRVRISKIIPADGFQQTVAGRRKRFRDKLTAAMAASGWSVGTAAGTFVRTRG